MISEYKAISLFSGAGGMDLGIHEAGFDILASIENDPYCCETLRASKALHNIQQIIEQDIRQVKPEHLLANLGLYSGELDLLFGGPPCQSFSQIGKRKGLADERGLLLFQMAEFAAIIQPKFVLIEQVRGLLSARGLDGKKGAVFKAIVREFEQLGYHVQWQLLNAADYGVPQLRKRVFIIGSKDEYGFTFPQPTHTQADSMTPLFSLKPYVKVREALANIGKAKAKNSLQEDSHIDITPARDIERISCVPEGSYLAAQTHLPETLRGKLTKKDTTKFRRLSYDEPALTLRGGETFYHPTENRYLTPRECMRLHTFPDDYILKGPIRGRSGSVKNLDQHRQVANAVPPLLARVIAQQIVKALNACPKYMSYSVIP